MPTIQFGEHTITCTAGENLRTVLLDRQLPLYNGIARHIHCRGIGTCGTCAVEIQSAVAAIDLTRCVTKSTLIERARLSFPPHRSENQFRLACQVQVLGDIKVFKHKGMWGHQVYRES